MRLSAKKLHAEDKQRISPRVQVSEYTKYAVDLQRDDLLASILREKREKSARNSRRKAAHLAPCSGLGVHKVRRRPWA